MVYSFVTPQLILYDMQQQLQLYNLSNCFELIVSLMHMYIRTVYIKQVNNIE